MFDKIKSFFTGKGKDQQGGRYEGVVKKLHYKKGFGFIDSKAFEKLIFVHFSDANTKLRVGKKVRFAIQDTDKGPRAVDVEVIS